MSFPFLKSMHYISLYIFLGAPAFWYIVWRPAVGDTLTEEGRMAYTNVRAGLVFGFLLFLLSGLADIPRAAADFVEGTNAASLLEFLGTSKFGQLTVLKLVLAVFAAFAWHLPGRDEGGALVAIPAVISGGLLVVMGFLSNAGSEPGLFPVISDVVHLLASIVWVGGVFFLAILPWKFIRGGEPGIATPFSTLIERFSNVALLAVGLVVGTGAFASYLHVYTPVALQTTNYGRTLAVKLGLFFVIMLMAALNYLVISPGLQRAGRQGDTSLFQKSITRLSTYLRAEAIAVVGLLVAVGVLTSLSPGETFDDTMRGQWELELGTYSARAVTSPGQQLGEVQIDLHVADAAGEPVADAGPVVFDLFMPGHDMGIPPVEAELLAPGHYRARPLLSMEGDWEATIHAFAPGGETVTAAFQFEAPKGARSVGQTRRFDVRAVFFEVIEAQHIRPIGDTGGFDLGAAFRDFVFSTDGRPMNFVAGILWFAAAIYVVVASRRRGLPRWTTPLGMIGVAIGGYLLFTSMLVDAYPTQFVRNPVPFTAASVATGKQLYVAHCSQCHGPEGFGDGELAPLLDPPPEDLRVRHVDFHPDGELFWWFTHGIPGTEMPGMGAAMTEEERWHVVNFVRSLHREVPADDSI